MMYSRAAVCIGIQKTLLDRFLDKKTNFHTTKQPKMNKTSPPPPKKKENKTHRTFKPPRAMIIKLKSLPN